MSNKKTAFTLLTSLVLVGSLLAGCGDKNSNDSAAAGNGATAEPAAKTTEFSFYYTGSQNVDDLWKTLIPMFEAKNPDIKVKPVYVASGTGAQPTYDRILAAKQANKGSGDIDLYEDGIDSVNKGKNDDIWDTLSENSIPNLKNVDENTLKDVSSLAIPYRASAVLLAYNSDKVKDAPKTLDELYDWIRKNPEKFAYNDPSTGGAGSSFVTTALYKFLPEEAIHNSDPSIMSQWGQGIDLLKDLGKYVYGKGIYPKKNQGTLDLLASGEVDMIPAWSDMVLDQISKGQLPATTKMQQITPGFNGGPTYLMVPKLSEKKDAVYKFLDFVVSPEAQTEIVNKMHGFPGIKLSNMPQEIQDSFKGASEGYRTFNLGDLGKEINKKWQSEVAAQ
ncbi:ABC transporter substrate-binding protein [Bacillus sp. FJAT-27264]|uniref:extracellular solute-binding protein n=1 Tax=Paenibacillus sp. (strain DSM 101736 / FJAT-27264) TaxID=1850362 RepID=UPI000807DD9A|nr:extracellular solute-binding protein [Bacillus sp. FJAT-27264]OBZ18712.1 ABC transporter substrate-binding protein [Bacillus sp. FJAT-27264]